ncbi:MAG: hypothetical protein E6Q75_02695 [Rheinheimera sp.]|nr:MAG: hypothetical protein E6Q75_02695 [Rheinheimera sp.]
MQHLRYGQLVGNVGQAVAAFTLAYLILHQAPVADYALLSLVLLLQAFGIALVNALVGSPLLILLHAQSPSKDGPVLIGFIWIAAGLAIGIAALQLIFAVISGQAVMTATWLALASTLQILRSALRSYWLNRHAEKVIQSDLLLTFSLLLPIFWLMLNHIITLQSVAFILVLATVLAIGPLLIPIRRWIGLTPAWPEIKQGLNQQGKPAALGVLTVELTANFHCYFVMLMSGSHAFAAIAAATLFFRPQAVILQSLQQSERAMIVQAWLAKCYTQLRQTMSVMHRLAVTAFLLNLIAIALVWYWQPDWLWPDPVTEQSFLLALLLWGGIAFLRGARLPISTVLQAADQFQPLARATYISAGLTIPAVCISWCLGGPIATLIGVLVGEVILAIQLKRTLDRLLSF